MSIQRLRMVDVLSPKLSSQQQQLPLTKFAVQVSAQKCPLVLVKNVNNVMRIFRDPHGFQWCKELATFPPC